MAVVLKSPVNGETVDVCAKYQHEFENCINLRQEKKLVKAAAESTEPERENTVPAPVNFLWETDSDESVLEISEDASFTEAREYTLCGNCFSVFNLKKDTVYYWRVNGSSPEKFAVDSLMPRWISVDGIGNVRDIGGRKNVDGVRIKQGLIYRGPGLEPSLTEKGREDIRELGIKTELDLRKEAAGTVRRSLIGDEVEYIQIACSAYEEFEKNGISDGTCKKLIELLADAGSYPVYFHCHGGADRTGTLAFFLDAILGLDDETMLRDYELTMLSSPADMITRNRKEKFRKFLRHIRRAGRRGDPLRDSAVAFLKKAKVSDDTIETLRKNLLEK